MGASRSISIGSENSGEFCAHVCKPVSGLAEGWLDDPIDLPVKASELGDCYSMTICMDTISGTRQPPEEDLRPTITLRTWGLEPEKPPLTTIHMTPAFFNH